MSFLLSKNNNNNNVMSFPKQLFLFPFFFFFFFFHKIAEWNLELRGERLICCAFIKLNQ